MLKKSIFLTLVLFLNLALFAETTFTKPATLSVMFSSYDAEITFSVDEDGKTAAVTVFAFSYGEKNMGNFTFSAERQDDGTFAAKKQVVQSVLPEKTIGVTITSAKVNPENEQVEIKFKPGKMPFNITLKTK